MRDYEPYYTEDGSVGLYSYADKDVYHSKFGALTEAWEKFVIPSDIEELLKTKQDIKVLDICYGIGYNTKSLMSFVIEKNKKQFLKKNLIKKIFKKIIYFASKCVNNIFPKDNKLSSYIDTISNDNILSSVSIDCLEINEELVKLSPFFKTVETPAEVYEKIVPQILDCFNLYYKLKDLYIKIASYFTPKNRKEIKELLDIKFKNMHIEKGYKVESNVNYLLINKLVDIYGDEYLDKYLKKILREKPTRDFVDKSLIKYARFYQKWGYKLSRKAFLSAFLHNIYYGHLTKRNKKIDFKAIESLFKLNFYINDARRSILEIDCEYDCVFLDAFTYTKAPQLWSVEFIAELYKRMAPSGVLLTYSNSAQVRNTLLENNFYVGKIYNEKTQKFVGTIASKDKSKIKYPLDNYEIGLCNTKAGIPYHDPNLCFDKKDILELREYEFRHSNLMSSSKYMKTRGAKNEL